MVSKIDILKAEIADDEEKKAAFIFEAAFSICGKICVKNERCSLHIHHFNCRNLIFCDQTAEVNSGSNEIALIVPTIPGHRVMTC